LGGTFTTVLPRAPRRAKSAFGVAAAGSSQSPMNGLAPKRGLGEPTPTRRARSCPRSTSCAIWTTSGTSACSRSRLRPRHPKLHGCQLGCRGATLGRHERESGSGMTCACPQWVVHCNSMSREFDCGEFAADRRTADPSAGMPGSCAMTWSWGRWAVGDWVGRSRGPRGCIDRGSHAPRVPAEPVLATMSRWRR